ncbi:hypothetical protein SPOG_02189 [Schizosaccharomyces cryophilus OY26]|uniref:Uncharacterized protein n=1 Tax=Schizosaccharomyces cryophilus (strain OY26 / ATCC MYA-4695 / CBS 11777 / NBRC 106824 / NRRL Y48691) TaxID=653667 RepID=S9W4N3_SCHCR|nr:uncharacterized protein SPOG_02189 [Schizosaccharomyces cryophilus OY26]EPY52870.1 hypothetical protein SPOG_02189 [Schizosaccharomyces cryophilus OY26]
MDVFWERMLNDPKNEFSEEQKHLLYESRSRVRRNKFIGIIGGFFIPIVLARKRKISPLRLYATSVISGIAGNGIAQIVTMGYNVSQVKKRPDGPDILRKIQQALIRQRAMMQERTNFPPSSNIPSPGQIQNPLGNGKQEASSNDSNTLGISMPQDSSNQEESPKSAWDRIREKNALNRTNGKEQKDFSFPVEDENQEKTSWDWPRDATDSKVQSEEEREFQKQQTEFDKMVWGSGGSSNKDLTT